LLLFSPDTLADCSPAIEGSCLRTGNRIGRIAARSNKHLRELRT